MIKYPNGSNYSNNTKTSKRKCSIELSISSANRGMNLENDINLSNDFYRVNNIAVIYKRPTPINIVKVDYSRGCKITEAYFETQSTTDYNGVYKSRYLDFEAKNTKSKTSFPLTNITRHQIEHLKMVIEHGGIAFFIINFEVYDETYLLDAKFVIDVYECGDRKSIPYKTFKEKGSLIEKGYEPRLKYIDAVDKTYFE